MKKLQRYCVIMAAALLLLAAGCIRPVYAAEKQDVFKAEGFEFEITDSDKHTVKLNGFSGSGSDEKDKLVIPAEITYKDQTYKVASIGNTAFAMTGIKSAVVPEGIKSIGDSAFAGCTKLKKIELPASLKSLGNGVFSYCRELDNITINDDSEEFIYIKGLLSSIERDKLYWASESISAELTLPDKTVEIMPYAFEGNRTLTKIVMKDGLTTIGKGAFFDCPSLEQAGIPKSVTKIDGNPFMYCSALTKIKVASKNANYRSTSDGLLLNAKKTTLISASAASGELTLPSKIKTVGEGAAAGNTKLTALAFDTKLKKIQPYAFADCVNLNKVTFANRKAVLAENGMIFKNAPYFIEVSIPYSEKAGSDGSIENMVRENSPKGVIITSR